MEHQRLVPNDRTTMTTGNKSHRGILLVAIIILGAFLLILLNPGTPSSYHMDTRTADEEVSSEETHSFGNVTIYDRFYRHELGEDYVCADGTPFVFYLRRPEPSSPNYDKWIIEVEGGGRWCEDNEACETQYAFFDGYFLSSRLEPCMEREPEGGLFSVHEEFNARFYDHSYVWIHACNGDDFLGQAGVGENGNPTDWHFTGSVNMWLTFEYLTQYVILEPESLFVMGPDSTGISFENQLNEMDEYFTARFPDFTTFFVIDGAWNSEEYMCYDESTCTHYLGDVALRYDNQNPALNVECTDDGHDEKCFYAAEYSMKYVHPDTMNKTLFIHSHFDSRMLNDVSQFLPPEWWQIERGEYLMQTIEDRAIPHLFATSCWQHVLSNKKDWWASTNQDGMSAMEAVNAHINGQHVWSVDEIYIVDGEDRCADGHDEDFIGNIDGYMLYDDCTLLGEPDWYENTANQPFNQTWVSVRYLLDSIQ